LLASTAEGADEHCGRGARELCTAYSKLLADSGFSQSIQQTLQTLSSPGFEATALRNHVNAAIALLVQAGVDGAQAVDALNSIQNRLTSGVTLPSIREPLPFFQLLRDAKNTACELSDRLQRQRRRRLVLAAVGLALVGLSGGALGVLAAPVGAALVPGVVGGGGAMAGALGVFIFEENARQATKT
jgi:hypothetical protein